MLASYIDEARLQLRTTASRARRPCTSPATVIGPQLCPDGDVMKGGGKASRTGGAGSAGRGGGWGTVTKQICFQVLHPNGGCNEGTIHRRLK